MRFQRLVKGRCSKCYNLERHDKNEVSTAYQGVVKKYTIRMRFQRLVKGRCSKCYNLEGHDKACQGAVK